MDTPPLQEQSELQKSKQLFQWKNNQLVGDYRLWRLGELREASYSRDRFLQIPPLEKLINYG